MPSVLLAGAFLLLTARWWWPLAVELLRAVDAAGSFLEEARRDGDTDGPAPAIDPRVRSGRILAFRGVEQRTRARRRWEGGFGRRGL